MTDAWESSLCCITETEDCLLGDSKLSAHELREMSALSARHLEGDVGAGELLLGGVCSNELSSIIAIKLSAFVGVAGADSLNDMSISAEKEGVGDGHSLAGERAGEGMLICGGERGWWWIGETGADRREVDESSFLETGRILVLVEG